MCLSCLLQKIMRREYIKAQEPSAFKEQLALIKNTPGKARGLSKRWGSLQCWLSRSSQSCSTASAGHSCSLGVPPPPHSGFGDSYWVPCDVPAWSLWIVRLNKNMENISHLPIPPSPKSCSPMGAPLPLAGGTQGWNYPSCPRGCAFSSSSQRAEFFQRPSARIGKKNNPN